MLTKHSAWILALVLEEGNANVHNPDRKEPNGAMAYGMSQTHLADTDSPIVHCTGPSETKDKDGCPQNKIQKMLEYGVYGPTKKGITPLEGKF